MANFDYENTYWWNGDEIVAGLDEAGRGSIAGPLVVGIVIFPPFYDNDEFNDSKQLTDRQRRKMFEKIKKDAVFYHAEIISVEEIDQYNIYAATQLGMERALKRVKEKVEAVLTDAMPLPHVKDIPVVPIIKGDQKSVTIAAASIVAKVTRDDIMIKYAKEHPEYNFEHNKGYCTEKHVEALNEYGILDIHRRTYEPVKSLIKSDEQLTIDEFINQE